MLTVFIMLKYKKKSKKTRENQDKNQKLIIIYKVLYRKYLTLLWEDNLKIQLKAYLITDKKTRKNDKIFKSKIKENWYKISSFSMFIFNYITLSFLVYNLNIKLKKIIYNKLI